MSFRTAITALANGDDLEALDFDDDGGVQIIVGDFVVIDFDAPPECGSVEMSASVAPLPADERETLLAEAMSANLACHQVSGAYLALDTEHDELVLCKVMREEGLTAPVLESEIATFLIYLDAWRTRVETGDFTLDDDPAANVSTPPSDAHLRV